jgi:peroxiredoxin
MRNAWQHDRCPDGEPARKRRRRAAAGVALGAIAATSPAWGAAAPDFRAPSTAGDTVQLSAFRGQVVIVDFWATWCPPCRDQLARLAALEEQIPELVVLAVNVDSRRDKVDAFARRVRLPRRVLLDPEGRIAARYAAQAMPWTVLIGPRGTLVMQRAGGDAAAFPQLAAEARRLAAEAAATGSAPVQAGMSAVPRPQP